jgi:hypothetical protein
MGTFRFMVRPEFLSLYILMEDLAQVSRIFSENGLDPSPKTKRFVFHSTIWHVYRRVNGKCTMSFKGLGPFFHVPNLIVLDAIQERQ